LLSDLQIKKTKTKKSVIKKLETNMAISSFIVAWQFSKQFP